MVKTTWIRCFCWLCLLLVTSSCQQTTQQEQEAAAKSAIHFAVAQAPINLDPRYATDAASERVNRLLYRSLVDFDEKARPVPELANWQTVNHQQYLFTLIDNIPSFQHGKALTAKDVKATYDSLIQLADSPHAAEFANIKEITVLNDHKVEFILNKPDRHFPARLIIGILPKDLIEQQHDFSRQPVGNGPFAFADWENSLQLKRVLDGQLVAITEVKDPTVRALKLVRGETDLIQGDLPPEMVRYLQNSTDVEIKAVQGANYSYLGLNMQDPILQKLKVRQALTFAINRQAIIDKIMVEHTRVANAILPPEHYAGNPKLVDYTYQPQLARQLLREAKVKMPLKLVYKTSTDAQRVRLATILQAQLSKVGIKLEIRSLDWGTFFDEVKKGDFQLYGLTWVGIKTPEIYSKVFGSQFMPPNGFNRGRYTDRALDKLLAKEDWQSVTEHIHAKLPYIPLWYEGQAAAMRTNIQGYEPKADGNWDGLITISRQLTVNQ